MNSQHTDTEPAKRLSQPTTESKPCSVGNKDSSNRNLNTEPVGIRFCIPSHGKPGDAKDNRTPVLGRGHSRKELRGSSHTESRYAR